MKQKMLRCTVNYFNDGKWDYVFSRFPISEIESIIRCSEEDISHPKNWFMLQKTNGDTFYISDDFEVNEFEV